MKNTKEPARGAQDDGRPLLDVRIVNTVVGAGVGLYDRRSGMILPGQVGGNLSYDVGDRPRLTLTFLVDGMDIDLAEGPRLDAPKAAKDRNDLAAASAAYAALSPANQARFRVMYGLTKQAQPLGRSPIHQAPRSVLDWSF